MNRVACIAAMVAAAFAPASASALQITQVIDEFITEMSAEANAPAPVTVVTGGPAVSALGGVREIAVFKTSGPFPEAVRARVNPLGFERLRVGIDEALGRVNVVWDGVDNGALDPGGLGGIDFSAYDKLELETTFSDIGGPVTFEFYNPLGDIARTTLAVPGGIPANSSVILGVDLVASNFTLVGPSTFPQILSNIGAVVMSVDARAIAQQGWDSSYEALRLVGDDGSGGTPEVPLPAPALLLLFGLGGLGALRMRRPSA